MARSIRTGQVRSVPTSTAPVAQEPCVSCGEETAAGSVFFSDRHMIEHADGRRSYLCSLCDARLRASQRGNRLTDEQVRQLVENGNLIATAWRP
jgi:hypothetical protein